LIEKFNFYDIYGYFVPGATFLAIRWIPFGIVRNSWPSSTWSSAIIAAAFAYILGHLVYSLHLLFNQVWQSWSTSRYSTEA